MPDFIAKRPSDVPTRETLGFLKSHVPVGANILEIGCGEGQVASELLSHGYHVTALDSDPEVIARARKRRVSAVRRRSLFRCDSLHSFIAPHRRVRQSDRSRTGITRTDGITVD